MYEIVILIFGMLIGTLPGWIGRKRRLRTHWAALRAEMDLCKEKAETIVGNGSTPLVLSPLYRLPLLAFEVSLPILLADGALSEVEAKSLSRFYSQVQDINRGLDNAAEMYKNDNRLLFKEHDRNRLKAETLVLSRAEQSSMYETARKIVNQKLAQKWWQYSRHA
jgi:hypothetical protein